MASSREIALAALGNEVIACRRCPRLVAWREEVAVTKRAAFRDEHYWGAPVPGFGDIDATVVVIGLAPAAHGANRTGRMFTGDRSGDWLFRAMYRAGLASQPDSRHRDDGLMLWGSYVTAPVRCAPPANQPTPQERAACQGFLQAELALLEQARVFVALGAFGYQVVAQLLGVARPRPPLRPWSGGGAARRSHVVVQLSRQPAEHLHRSPHGAHARRRFPAGGHPGRTVAPRSGLGRSATAQSQCGC